MRETEVTYQVFDDFETAERKLLDLGYKKIESILLEDNYYTSIAKTKVMSTEYSDLMKKTVIVRHLIFPSGKRVLKVCYKDKNLDGEGNVISEQKTEAHINDMQNMMRILANLGFSNWCYCFSQNNLYEKDGKQLLLQNVKNLGLLLEVEAFEDMEGMTADKKIEKLKKFVKGLNLDIGKDHSCKKAFMILHQKQI